MDTIREKEIHLWFAYDARIREHELVEVYRQSLCKEEIDQLSRFKFAKHRHQYLITRALVRSVLSHYADDAYKPAEWVFSKNRYGKPYIGNFGFESTLRFNLSHCEQMVVLAVTRDREIGVDVEWTLRPGKTVELADNYFSPEEVAQLHGLSVELKNDRFFDLWTLKEAYIKACGVGLSIPLNSFSFALTAHSGISISFSSGRKDQPEDWQFWQISPNQTHKVAVAIKDDACKMPYSIRMTSIVPMHKMTHVGYPIFRQSAQF
jgi:4'-phosphopantetheinyl transferase